MNSFSQAIYLDNNATTRPLPAVVAAIVDALDRAYGNPSSPHSVGTQARAMVEQARAAVAELIGAEDESIVFTSGATEANNAVLSLALAAPSGRRRVLTTAVEHSSILRVCDHLESAGVEVVRLAVDADGLISLSSLEEALRVPAVLVSVQWANGETGVVQPLRQIAELCQSRGVPFHTDAAQAVGKVKVDLNDVPVDYLTLAGHKLHAPKGVGALFVRSRGKLPAFVHGGGQERGLRAGTENVPGIVGLGVAATLRLMSLDSVSRAMGNLRDEFEASISQLDSVRINASQGPRVPNTTSIRFSGLDGQALVSRLDRDGVVCSQSSACASGRPEPSHVLTAMGLSERDAYSSVRFSFAETNTPEEMRLAVRQVSAACASLRDALGRRAS